MRGRPLAIVLGVMLSAGLMLGGYALYALTAPLPDPALVLPAGTDAARPAACVRCI